MEYLKEFEKQNYHKHFYYKNYLDRVVKISDTRIEKLADAVDKLHSAICYLDKQNLEKFDINQSVKDLISTFGELEGMRSYRDKKRFKVIPPEKLKQDWNNS